MGGLCGKYAEHTGISGERWRKEATWKNLEIDEKIWKWTFKKSVGVGTGLIWLSRRTRDGYLAYAVKEIQLPRNVVIPWLAEELLDSKKDPAPWSQLLSTIHTYIHSCSELWSPVQKLTIGRKLGVGKDKNFLKYFELKFCSLKKTILNHDNNMPTKINQSVFLSVHSRLNFRT